MTATEHAKKMINFKNFQENNPGKPLGIDFIFVTHSTTSQRKKSYSLENSKLESSVHACSSFDLAASYRYFEHKDIYLRLIFILWEKLCI